jgi:metacaspase-1
METDEFLRAYQELVEKHKINGATAATAVVSAAVSSAAPVPMKRALLIGINYFGQGGELHGCHNDIDNMQRYLRGCGFTQFTVLKDDNKGNASSSTPTRANILAAMKKFIADSSAGMTLYVHYSGHGSQLWDQNGEEVDCKDECICPVDYSSDSVDTGFIRDDEMSEILVKGLPEGVKLRVCFDSCHSGSALDLPFRWVSNTRMVAENAAKINRDIIFISGCMDSQTSADSSFNGQSAGAMTWSLLEALYDVQKSGRHASKWTWKEVIQAMRMKLRTGQYDQIPQLGLCDASHAGVCIDLI